VRDPELGAVLSALPQKRLTRSQVNPKTVLVVGLVTLALALVALIFARASLSWLLILISAYLAAALNHPVEWLQKRMRRGVAITLVMVAWLLLAVGVIYLFIPPLVDQAQALIQEAPSYLRQLRHSQLWTDLEQRFHIDQKLKGMGSGAPQQLTGVVSPVLTALTGAVKVAGALISIYFLVLFMLTSGGALVQGWLKETSPARRGDYARITGRIYHAIGGYVLGLLIIMGINATLTSIFLGVIGVPFYLPLGVLSGLGSLLPMVGAFIAGALITVVALATGGVWAGVAAVAYYLVYQLIENHVLSPVIYRRTVNINPLVLLAGLLVFAELGGLLAAVLSVPVIATGQIILQALLQARRERLGMPPPAAIDAPPVIDRGDVDGEPESRAPH
jgi:predicted PurR-regulated permease PerM